jgi:two-component system response regulator HydG
MPSILIVDDLVSIHEMLEAVIEPTGLTATFATDGEQALEKYKAGSFDLVLTDIDMSPMDGITLLKSLRALDPHSVVIIMTAFGSTESAIQALKLGAFDYIQKPFRVEELLKTIRRAMEFRQYGATEGEPIEEPVPGSEDWATGLRASGPAMKRLIQQLKKLIGANSAVLFQGETGTGKRRAAELLHAASHPEEAGAPFVRVDCSRSREADFEVKLFGAESAGGQWVEEAAGGTLFLDNIPVLPLEMQKVLVGVLKNAGGSFRLMVSSVVDLEAQVDEGGFDDELFYRLASLPVLMPPLRDRTEDIPLLIGDIVRRTGNASFGSDEIEFTDDAIQTLCAHYWPGNIPELNQVVSKLVSTTDSKIISSRQLPMRLRELSDWPSLDDYLAGQEKEYIAMVLNACQDDRAQAARILKCDASRLV